MIPGAAWQGPDGHSYGIHFYGTDGTWFVDRKLAWETAQEESPGDAEANKMLAKDYRKPWVVA